MLQVYRVFAGQAVWIGQQRTRIAAWHLARFRRKPSVWDTRNFGRKH